MALKLKLKARPKPAEVVEEQSFDELLAMAIDEAADAQKALDALNAEAAKLKLKAEKHREKLETLSKVIDLMEQYGEDDQFKLNSKRTMVEVKKKGIKREIKEGGMEAIRKMLKQDTFFKIATVSLGDLDKYLNPEQKKEVLNVDRTIRTFKFHDTDE